MSLLLVAAAARSLADDRDDDVFGAPSAPAETPAPADDPAPTDSADLGEVTIEKTTDADIASRLGVADDRLTLGGKLWVRAEVDFVEDGDLAEAGTRNPNLLDVYADARPNERVRAYALGRVKYDFTVGAGETDAFGNALEPGSVLLDQLWLKFDVGHLLYVTAGRQRIKWGSGKLWNPTDFMNQQALDPLAVFDERTGVGLLKLHVPVEAIGANLYAVGNFEGARELQDLGGSVRTEWVLGPSEIALSYAARAGDATRLGADISAGVGPFDLHVEGAARYGDPTEYYRGELDLEGFDTLETPEAYTRRGEWIPQVVAGAEVQIKLGDEDYVAIGAEYFYNDGGYDDVSIYPWLLFQGAYRPFYTGEHYVGGYVYLPGPGQADELTVMATTIANLSDESAVSRLQLSYRALTYLDTYAWGQYHYGNVGEFRYGYEFSDFAVSTFGLPYDEIPAPVAEVGIGASVAF